MTWNATQTPTTPMSGLINRTSVCSYITTNPLQNSERFYPWRSFALLLYYSTRLALASGFIKFHKTRGLRHKGQDLVVLSQSLPIWKVSFDFLQTWVSSDCKRPFAVHCLVLFTIWFTQGDRGQVVVKMNHETFSVKHRVWLRGGSAAYYLLQHCSADVTRG